MVCHVYVCHGMCMYLGLIYLFCVNYEVDDDFENELMHKGSKENLIGKLACIWLRVMCTGIDIYIHDNKFLLL